MTTTSESSARLTFPAGFRWGTATAAYQIEGAVAEDGRGPSIWDTFSHTPGRIDNGDTGDVACDHYHRVAEDVAIMADLGLTSYRFSIAWSRVLPAGPGAVNQAGLDFYGRLVDQLLAHDIEPLITLYHWDLPQALDDTGGWRNRDTAAHLADYAAIVGTALGDRVPSFTTLNEPWCSTYLGYAVGVHAPGHRNYVEAFQVAHHLNLGHGLATAALRSVLPASGQVSVTLNLAQVVPHSDAPDDLDAARHVDSLANLVFLDPILAGRYPPDLIEDTRGVTDWSFVHADDLAAIHVPIDWLGVNYYEPALIAAPTPERRAAISPESAADPLAAGGPAPYPGTDRALVMPHTGPSTAMGWSIVPSGLRDLLLRLHRDYPGLPLRITENGVAFDDVVGPDGSVDDADRIAYLRGHLAAVHDAIEQGADVRGYYVWSLLDNFEWSYGFAKRFGLVRTDYPSCRRTLKASAHWMREVIATNGVPDTAV